jgi:hypothetical protein
MGSLIRRLERILTFEVVWSSQHFDQPTKMYVPEVVWAFR